MRSFLTPPLALNCKYDPLVMHVHVCQHRICMHIYVAPKLLKFVPMCQISLQRCHAMGRHAWMYMRAHAYVHMSLMIISLSPSVCTRAHNPQADYNNQKMNCAFNPLRIQPYCEGKKCTSFNRIVKGKSAHDTLKERTKHAKSCETLGDHDLLLMALLLRRYCVCMYDIYMCLCAYVCMYVCIYIHTYIYIHIYAWSSVCVCVCTRAYVCAMCMHVHLQFTCISMPKHSYT